MRPGPRTLFALAVVTATVAATGVVACGEMFPAGDLAGASDASDASDAGVTADAGSASDASLTPCQRYCAAVAAAGCASLYAGAPGGFDASIGDAGTACEVLCGALTQSQLACRMGFVALDAGSCASLAILPSLVPRANNGLPPSTNLGLTADLDAGCGDYAETADQAYAVFCPNGHDAVDAAAGPARTPSDPACPYACETAVISGALDAGTLEAGAPPTSYGAKLGCGACWNFQDDSEACTLYVAGGG